MSQLEAPVSPAPDDDLGKWLDLDGLCQTEEGIGDELATPDHAPDSSLDGPTVKGRDMLPQEMIQFECRDIEAVDAKTRRRTGARNTNMPDYSVICFPSNPSHPNGVKKKRKDFDERRRLEVAQVRKSGACFRCKMRRISCGMGNPCRACEKAAGSLGAQLCIREKLTKMRFSAGDLHYIDYTARLLDYELIAGTTHLGPPRMVGISMEFTENPVLHLEVQDYFGNQAPPWMCCWVVMNPIGGEIEYHREESARYAMSRLAPAQDLIEWVEKMVVFQDTRTIGFQQAIDMFIMKYSKSSPTLPMHDLVRRVHELNCLTKLRLGLFLCVDDQGKTLAPSCALQTQFGQISKTSSQPIEKEVLNELEKIVFGPGGIGPSNGMALWASLWCLILMYRKLVRSYIAFQNFPCHVPEDYSGFPESKLEVGTHFYHYLVSIYAALFRATSPLYADLRLAAMRDMLNNDESLIGAFINLRTESFYFQRESHWMTATEDQLLRQMILNREAELQPKRAAGP